MDPIIRKNIDLLALKEPDNFYKKDVFDGTFKFIEKKGNRYYFKRNSDNSHSSTFVIEPYMNKEWSVTSVSDSKYLYNIMCHYVFSELVINEGYRHVCLPIMFFDIEKEELKKYPDVYAILKENEKSKFNVFVYERYAETKNLEQFIKEEKMTLKHWKVLFFQVFFILAKINEIYKVFRHNKLNLDSFKVYKVKENEDTFKQYKIAGTVFSIPNMGFELKLTNFYDSVLEEYFSNNTTTKKQPNEYYDIHYFISSLLLSVDSAEDFFPQDVNLFFNAMVHENFRPNKSSEFDGLNEIEFNMVSSELITPHSVLTKNNFFKEFIMNDISASETSNERVKLSRLNKRYNDVNYSSPTDDGGSRMLARQIDNSNLSSDKNIKKNSRQYNKSQMNRADKITSGTKKNIVSGFSNKNDDISDSRSFKRNTKKSKEIESSSDDGESPRNRNTNRVNRKNESSDRSNESTSASTGASTESSNRSSNRSSESSRDERRQKRNKESSSSSSISSLSSPSDSSQSSQGGHLSRYKQYEIYGSEFANKMKNIPDNYRGEVPDHVWHQMAMNNPDVGQNIGTTLPQGAMPLPEVGPLQLPIMTGNPMANPMMGNPMMANPMMANPMMANQMMGNPMMGNPMMASQMRTTPMGVPMMGGGNKESVEGGIRYRFVKGKQRQKKDKSFFF
jgi:hypothetical protein